MSEPAVEQAYAVCRTISLAKKLGLTYEQWHRKHGGMPYGGMTVADHDLRAEFDLIGSPELSARFSRNA